MSPRSRHPLPGIGDASAMHGTTVLAIKKEGRVSIGADGQVTMNDMVIKGTARKVRRLHEGRILTGFAGATADAMTLFEKLESKLQSYGGNLQRAAVELAKDWRSDRYLRRLEALLLAADETTILLISGNGDVIEPDEGVVAIGSGGGFALAAARAMMDRPEMNSEQIARRALEIAASICIYTNASIHVETL
jgi:ATP-dependent HslUV protease, peptidase subunit HslV